MNLYREIGLTLSLITLLTISATAQQTRTQNRDATDRTRVQAVDELGLRLARENLEQEGSINPENYIVGVNDIFAIEVKGSISFSYRGIAVNPLGDLVIPEVATVSVADLLLLEAIEKIRTAVSQRFRDGEVFVTLELARPINVHLSGNVPLPGRATLPRGTRLDLLVTYGIFPESLTPELQLGRIVTKIERLIASDYDLRNIRIIRKDGSIEFGDLIAYNLGGKLAFNPILEDGDIVNIRRRTENEANVSISGSIGTALNLPFRDGDTVGDLITMGGGIGTDALNNVVWVIRLQDHRFETTVLTLEEAMVYPLEPSDRVIIPTDPVKRRHRTVRIRGEAKNPGTYPVISGQTTLRELLDMAGGITDEANQRLVKIERFGENSWDSRNRDINLNELTDLSDRDRGQWIRSHVRTSDQFREGLDFLISELELGLTLIYVDLNNDDHLNNIILYGNDKITVMRDERTVLMMGQVQRPGYLQHESSFEISDYIVQSGGFAPAADLDRIFIIKKGTNAWYRPNETTIDSGDIIYVDRFPPESYQAFRLYEIQRQQLRNNNIQIILSTVSTVAAIVTTYLFIVRD